MLLVSAELIVLLVFVGVYMKKALREGEEMPEIFTDPLVARSSYWVLSTSAIFSEMLFFIRV